MYFWLAYSSIYQKIERAFKVLKDLQIEASSLSLSCASEEKFLRELKPSSII
jgi:hypothetical protein